MAMTKRLRANTIPQTSVKLLSARQPITVTNMRKAMESIARMSLMIIMTRTIENPVVVILCMLFLADTYSIHNPAAINIAGIDVKTAISTLVPLAALTAVVIA